MMIPPFFSLLRELANLPRVSVNLMAERAAQNDPFYAWLARDFYEGANRRHPKFPLVRSLEYGVALCPLPASFDAYLAGLEASARRNCRKAERLGYAVRRFGYNSRLEEVREIWTSTPVRQGLLPRAR